MPAGFAEEQMPRHAVEHSRLREEAWTEVAFAYGRALKSNHVLTP